MKTEVQRIEEDAPAEELEAPSILVSAKAGDANESLNRIKEVLSLVARASVNDTWPSDDEWSEQLPSWFVDPFQDRTLEEVLADKNLWDYGSWLDAMRHRGWQWWSVSTEGDQWRLCLLQEDTVYSIEPLIYLAHESGAISVEVTEQ